MTLANGRTIPTNPSALENALPGILTSLDADQINFLDSFQQTVAAGVLMSTLIRKPGKVTSFVAKALVGGTAGTTTVKLRKIAANGVVGGLVEVATVDLPNADPDGRNYAGTLSVVPGATDLAVGDMLYIEVTAAATAATGLTASAAFEHLAVN